MNKIKRKICSLIKAKRGEMLLETVLSITIFSIIFSAVVLNLITSINNINRTIDADGRYTALIADNMNVTDNYNVFGKLYFEVERPAPQTSHTIEVDIRQFTMDTADDKNPFGVISFKPREK